MPFLPSIPENATVASVFAKFNTGVEKPLLQLHQVLMRGDDSPFTIAQRELLGAYVSGVADCNYCAGSHSKVAEKFGIEEELFTELLEDVDKANIDDKLKPIFKFVKKLTLEPTKMIQDDTNAILDAGWNDRAIYDAIMICGTWNFMNRFAFGLDLNYNLKQSEKSAEMLVGGYDRMIKHLGLK